MAKAYIVMFSLETQKWARLASGTNIAVLGAHEGNSIDLDFTEGEAHSAALAAGLYEVCVEGANARFALGENAVATQQSRYWPAGRERIVHVRAGQRISITKAV